MIWWRMTMVSGAWCALVALGWWLAAAEQRSVAAILVVSAVVLGASNLAAAAGARLGQRLWSGEAIVAWMLLGGLICFVDPASLGWGMSLGFALVALLGVAASPALAWAAWRGNEATAHYRRRGYLGAAILCGLVVLRTEQVVAPVRALCTCLLLTIGVFALWRYVHSGEPALTEPEADEPAPTLPPPPVQMVRRVGRGTM